jgi:hypothetical protein
MPWFPYSYLRGGRRRHVGVVTDLPPGEEIVRRSRLAVIVVVVVLVWVAAPAQASSEPMSWGGFAERFVGWVEGVWRAVAGSEGEVPAEGDPESVALDGTGETTEFGSPEPQGEKFPALDPDG